MKSKLCMHCGRSFPPTRKSQKYCTETDCRRSCKRRWQKQKLRTDTDYKAAQREAQSRWFKNNPDYYRRYRYTHPDYTERNRQLQKIRNRRRLKGLSAQRKIAKMGAKPVFISGLYRLLPLEKEGDIIAKMESKVVQLTLLQAVT